MHNGGKQNLGPKLAKTSPKSSEKVNILTSREQIMLILHILLDFNDF